MARAEPGPSLPGHLLHKQRKLPWEEVVKTSPLQPGQQKNRWRLSAAWLGGEKKFKNLFEHVIASELQGLQFVPVLWRGSFRNQDCLVCHNCFCLSSPVQSKHAHLLPQL